MLNVRELLSVRSPSAAWLAGLLTLGGATGVAAPADPPGPKDLPDPPAATCTPSPAVTDKEALKLELTRLAAQARQEVEGSDAELAIKATIAGKLMGLGDAHFACKLSRELLLRGPDAATAARLRCQQVQHCGAPAQVQCPAGTVHRETHGCEAAAQCGVSGWTAQWARCKAQGDPACCSSALIVREYDLLEAGAAQRPEHRKELRRMSEAACKVGVSWACTQAATMISRSSSAAAEEAQIVALRRRACSLGRLEGCTPAGPR